MRSAKAFTLIEVVMAMAIALIIVTVIYTTTQAMATTAKRQGEMSEKDAQTAKFLGILRRDVRGRSLNQLSRVRRQLMSKKVLIKLRTRPC